MTAILYLVHSKRKNGAMKKKKRKTMRRFLGNSQN